MEHTLGSLGIRAALANRPGAWAADRLDAIVAKWSDVDTPTWAVCQGLFSLHCVVVGMAADGAVSMLDAPLQVLESLHLLPSSAPGDNRVHRREVARYLRDLARTPLDVVEQHPAQQQSAAASLEHQLLDLSLRSTHTFVDIQSACNEFPTLFEACDTTFSSLTTQHAPKVEDAARLFHTTAQKAMASRKAMERMDDVLDAALLPLLQYPTLIRACVAQAQYEEALQLMQRYFDVLPAKDGGMHHIIEALHTDMHHVLLHVQHVFLEALATPSLTLAQARSYTHYLARSIQLHQHTFSETPSDLQMPDVCFAFLYTRQRRLQTVLEHESPVLDVIERWRTLMLSTCTMTLSLFMDSPITDTDVAACTQLFASFTVLAIETLYAFVSAHLRRSWTPTDAVSTWEATTEGWAELYAKLCVTSDSLSDVGAALCLSMITEPSMEAGASNVWESTALQLWRAALRAVRTEPVAPVPSSSSKPSDVQHVPPSVRTSPACYTIAHHLVAALNVLRHFAPRSLTATMVSLLGARLAALLPSVPTEHRTLYIDTLVPWATRALVQGVYGSPEDAMALLHTCSAWTEALSSLST